MTPLTKYAAAGVITLAVVGGALGGTYFLGKSHGEAAVTVKWDKEKRERDAASLSLVQKNKALEEENRRLSVKIEKELEQYEANYDTAIADARADFGKRLQLAENRAGIYRKQAESGAAECSRLASHAAELDRSLEEGRGLVQELRETIRLRDSQLMLLGEQILADRALLN